MICPPFWRRLGSRTGSACSSRTEQVHMCPVFFCIASSVPPIFRSTLASRAVRDTKRRRTNKVKQREQRKGEDRNRQNNITQQETKKKNKTKHTKQNTSDNFHTQSHTHLHSAKRNTSNMTDPTPNHVTLNDMLVPVLADSAPRCTWHDAAFC